MAFNWCMRHFALRHLRICPNNQLPTTCLSSPPDSCLPVYISTRQYLYLSTNLHVYIPICLLMYLLVYYFICLFTCLPVPSIQVICVSIFLHLYNSILMIFTNQFRLRQFFTIFQATLILLGLPSQKCNQLFTPSIQVKCCK